MNMFAPGRRLFTVACLVMFLVALLHTIGNTLSSPPSDAEYAAMEAAMRDYEIPLGLGMTPSVWDIYRGLVFTMSLCLVAMAGLGLVVASTPESTPRLLSRIATIEAAASGALTLLYLAYQITPALVSMAVVTVLFAAAIRTTLSARA